MLANEAIHAFDARCAEVDVPFENSALARQSS